MKRPVIFSLILITFFIFNCYGDNKIISSSFNLNRSDLENIISDQPVNIQNNILKNPERFLELAEFMLNHEEEIFYLADKGHAVSRDQAPKKLVNPQDYNIAVSRKDLRISALAINSLKMMSDQAKKDGYILIASSGYRPYDYQKQLYNRYVNELGQKAADRISAKPGTSQHQLGTTIDFGSITDEYAETNEGKWLAEHAGEYGFSLSYPEGYEDITGYKWECWHYRYITVVGIQMQEEFFENIQQYLMVFWHNHKEQLQAARN